MSHCTKKINHNRTVTQNMKSRFSLLYHFCNFSENNFLKSEKKFQISDTWMKNACELGDSI